MRRFAWCVLLAALGCGVSDPPALPTTRGATDAVSGPTCSLGIVGADGTSELGRTLRAAVLEARFDEVIDLGPDGEARCAKDASCKRIARTPYVDVAVIVFEPGCAPAYANAMLSDTLHDVKLARFDPTTLAVQGVRHRRWNQRAWEADASAERAFTPADDVLPSRRDTDSEAKDFVVPYPASNFKLLVAVKILELVDRRQLHLSTPVERAGRTREVGAWLDDMITWSDDDSTEALVRTLHTLGQAQAMNALFASLGLSTLQIHDTSGETGRNWQPGRIHMSAWDTARLLWLLDPDAPIATWVVPGGAPVSAQTLSPRSKRRLFEMLHDQALHDVLSTTSLCGRAKTARGIPALLPDRWLGREGIDATPCNTAAEVTFAHKTGLTLNFGSDAGIVRGIPGRARRHYIFAFFSNLGFRYTDPDKITARGPCTDLGICYTQRIAAMAARVDEAIAAASGDRDR